MTKTCFFFSNIFKKAAANQHLVDKHELFLIVVVLDTKLFFLISLSFPGKWCTNILKKIIIIFSISITIMSSDSYEAQLRLLFESADEEGEGRGRMGRASLARLCR